MCEERVQKGMLGTSLQPPLSILALGNDSNNNGQFKWCRLLDSGMIQKATDSLMGNIIK